MRTINFFLCPHCTHKSGIAIAWQNWLFEPRRMLAEVADFELDMEMHKLNHKLDKLETIAKVFST